MKKFFKKVLTFSYLRCIIVTYSYEQPQNELRTECKNKKQKQTKNKRKLKEKSIMTKSIKTRIISIATAALMTLSLATATMASASAATVDTTSVSASQSTTIKLNLSSEWKMHNARFAAYFFNKDTGANTWANVSCNGYMGNYASVYGGQRLEQDCRPQAQRPQRRLHNQRLGARSRVIKAYHLTFS